jgi:hypothetical protein
MARAKHHAVGGTPRSTIDQRLNVVSFAGTTADHAPITIASDDRSPEIRLPPPVP